MALNGVVKWLVSERIKILFIDWNKTLSNSKFWGHLDNPLNQTNQKLYLELQKTLFEGMGDFVGPWMRGKYDSEFVMAEVAKRSRVPFDTVWSEFEVGCRSMEFISPEIPNIIKQTRDRGCRVVIASDNMDSFERFTLPAMRLGSIFSEILNSHSLRALKGDFDGQTSLFFGDYLRRQGVKPDECVLLDDSEDLKGKIAEYGIAYRRVTPENGLIEQLNTFLDK